MKAVAFGVHAFGEGVAQVHFVLEEEAAGGGPGRRGVVGVLRQGKFRRVRALRHSTWWWMCLDGLP